MQAGSSVLPQVRPPAPAGSCGLSPGYIFPGCFCQSLAVWKNAQKQRVLLILSVKEKKKKYNSPTSKPNKQKILHDSWAGPGEASPRPCTSPGWCSAPSTWGGLEGDWGFQGCISYQTCSSTALVVMASISNIFKVIWALPPYDFLALGGKIGRID